MVGGCGNAEPAKAPESLAAPAKPTTHPGLAVPFGWADAGIPTADGGLYVADDNGQIWFLRDGKAQRVRLGTPAQGKAAVYPTTFVFHAPQIRRLRQALGVAVEKVEGYEQAEDDYAETMQER